jgi:hypothetical protein
MEVMAENMIEIICNRTRKRPPLIMLASLPYFLYQAVIDKGNQGVL